MLRLVKAHSALVGISLFILVAVSACQSTTTANVSPTATSNILAVKSVTPIPFPTSDVTLTPTSSLHLLVGIQPQGLDLTHTMLSVSPDRSIMLIYDHSHIQIWNLVPTAQLVTTLQFSANDQGGIMNPGWLPDSTGFLITVGTNDIFVTRTGTETLLSHLGVVYVTSNYYPAPQSNAIALELLDNTQNILQINFISYGIIQPHKIQPITGNFTLLGWLGSQTVVYANGRQILGYNIATNATMTLATLPEQGPLFPLATSPDGQYLDFAAIKTADLYTVSMQGLKMLITESGASTWYGSHTLVVEALVGAQYQLFQIDPAASPPNPQRITAFPSDDFSFGSGPWLAYTPPQVDTTLDLFDLRDNRTVTIFTNLNTRNYQLYPTGDGAFYLLYGSSVYLIQPV